jgi:ubiquinone/menaquinone biosynthesis C-methylase UbiE
LQENSPEFFEEWVLYNKILKNDYMFHSEIFTKIQKTLNSKLNGRDYSLLDIGCGEAFGINKYLSNTNLRNYYGIDNSETALSWAEKNLATKNIKYFLLKSDFLKSLEIINDEFDVFLAGYSLHHLKTFEEKKDILHKFIEKLPYGGIFILFDLIKKDEETIEEYHARYIQNCKENWNSINQNELKKITHHIENNDYPLTLEKWREVFLSSQNDLTPISIDIKNQYYVLMIFQKNREKYFESRQVFNN